MEEFTYLLQESQQSPMHGIADTRLGDAAVDVVVAAEVLLGEEFRRRAKEIFPAPHEQALVRDLERVLGRMRIHDDGHALLP